MVPISYYLLLSAILFVIGVTGVLTRRNAVVILMCIVLMLSAVSLAFVAFARQLVQGDGQVFALLVMVVAAAEVAVGLAILISLYRNRETVDVSEVNLLKW